MNAYGTDQLAKFLVRLNVNGYLTDEALTSLVETLGDAARNYGPGADPQFRADIGEPPLTATVKVITEADATLANLLYGSLTEELYVLTAITDGPNTGVTDGIDDMNPVLEAALADGYIDANAINFPALKKQMDGPSEPDLAKFYVGVGDTDRPDIAADPGK